MQRRGGFVPIKGLPRYTSSGNLEDLIYVSFSEILLGREVFDQFLWPKDNDNVYEMKAFAANYLTDIFGPNFSDLECHIIEGKIFKS